MSGRETPWLLLRGLTREAGHWGAFPTQLRAALGGAPVLTPDLPGAGTRHREASPASIDALVRAVRAEHLDRHGPGPVKLLGLSLGGLVAAHWLMHWPEDVAAAVVVNTSTAALSPFWQRLRPAAWPDLAAVAAGWGSPAAEARILALSSATPGHHAGVVAGWVAIAQRHPVARANALRQLHAAARAGLPAGRPSCPVLVVASAGDGLVDPRCSQALARHWACPLAWHPSAGHDLALDDGPWLAAEVARFDGAQVS